MAPAIKIQAVPRDFVWRRLHSLMGLWLVIFLFEHLFTNSQVALFFANQGLWFVRSVNFLRNLPYLQVIECVMLGIPILYHAGWGVYYTFTGSHHSFSSDGSKPLLKYGRSRAYSWQRLSAWIILVGIILHVIQMRFIHYPYKYKWGDKTTYYTKLDVDDGLYKAADQLGVEIYSQKAVEKESEKLEQINYKIRMLKGRLTELEQEDGRDPHVYRNEMDQVSKRIQHYQEQKEHIRGLQSRTITDRQVMAASPSFGKLELLNVRGTFQSVTMCILYTIFVLATVFHGMNGVWTFLITWGLILSRKSHAQGVTFTIGLMFLLGFLGLMSIWGTFFLSA